MIKGGGGMPLKGMNRFLRSMRVMTSVGVIVLLALAGCDSHRNTTDKERAERVDEPRPLLGAPGAGRVSPLDSVATRFQPLDISENIAYPATYRWRPIDNKGDNTGAGSRHESGGGPLQDSVRQVADAPSGYWRGKQGVDANGHCWCPPPLGTSAPSRSIQPDHTDDTDYADSSQWRYPGALVSSSDRLDRGDDRWLGYGFRPWQSRDDEVAKGYYRRGLTSDARGGFANGGWLETPGGVATRSQVRDADQSRNATREAPTTGYGELRRWKDSNQGGGTRQTAVSRRQKTDTLYQERLDFFTPIDPIASPGAPPPVGRASDTWVR